MVKETVITYKTDLEGVDWTALKSLLEEDDFDNGRTPEKLKQSFENSRAVVFALDGARVIGKARALSDGVCNAYVVDVWTYSPYRNRGIASMMMECLMEKLPGQHVYLFTDDAEAFYEKLGFRRQGIGLFKVVGQWLVNEPGDV
ncbi:MAG: GNAT family N-acetyltransferase [Anaerolineales bacterium]|nr:GNAT family N-acetyltransferase [Anaerolineales bacterium]